MRTPARIAVTALATIVALYASGWLGFLAWIIVTVPFKGQSEDYSNAAWVQSLCSLAGAVLGGRYTWRRTGTGGGARPGVFATTLRWAFIAGGIGFAIGFFGPIVFTPGANQGPLLRIFITGPLGFVGGAASGFARAISTPPGPSNAVGSGQ